VQLNSIVTAGESIKFRFIGITTARHLYTRLRAGSFNTSSPAV